MNTANSTDVKTQMLNHFWNYFKSAISHGNRYTFEENFEVSWGNVLKLYPVNKEMMDWWAERRRSLIKSSRVYEESIRIVEEKLNA